VRWLVAEATRLAYQAQLDWIAGVQRTLAGDDSATARPARALRRPLPASVEPRDAVA
jgi:hypothetical protein